MTRLTKSEQIAVAAHQQLRKGANKMKSIQHNGFTIEREHVETASRGYTEYRVTFKDASILTVERLYAARYAIDSHQAGKPLTDIIRDLRSDGLNVHYQKLSLLTKSEQSAGKASSTTVEES
jgi:hypothetical protein